jgi:type VI secretion system secreted protein Hcp
MAINLFLKMVGGIQGEIKGPVTQIGQAGSIGVIAFNHEVVVPRDAQSGLAAGKPQHKPLTIVKEIDCTSPALMKMLVTNECIKTWELRFWRTSTTGKYINYFTIQLQSATIASIKQQLPENLEHTEREEVSFFYEKIIWSFEETKQRCEDNLLTG